jgi:hypothetical protein
MAIDEMHPEDIKAALRKQFGSVFAFEDAKSLPRKSVSDWLRGRQSQRVKDAIEGTLSPSQSDKADDSGASLRRQNVARAA